MWTKIRLVFSLPDLRNKILLTVLLLFTARIFAHVPLPGISKEALDRITGSQLFGLLDLFSGGSIAKLSVVMLGVGPYITASIIFQLLTYVIPSLEALQKEGEHGRQKINQYTRLATVPLAALQSYATLALLRSQNIIPMPTGFNLFLIIASSVAGTIFLMWLGEIISERGIGNGISLLITLGIISRLPMQVAQALAFAGIDFNAGSLRLSMLDSKAIFQTLFFGLLALAVLAAVVFINEGIRNIPVTYARGLRRGFTSSVQSTLPIRVNSAGVIPIIFAISLMIFPSFLAQFLTNARSYWLRKVAFFLQEVANPSSFWYPAIYFVLVFLFTFFYTSVVFQPKKIAENLQKQSGFIPGIRPGLETEEYLGKIINRITLAGAIFLGLIAVLPAIIQQFTGSNVFTIGGTGILIVVSVIIETLRALRAQIITHTYEKY